METRVNVPYTPMYERFVNKKIDFAKQVIPCFLDDTQYNSFYEIRLKEMRPILVDRAKAKWGDSISILSSFQKIVITVQQRFVIYNHIPIALLLVLCIIFCFSLYRYKELSLFKSILNEKVSSAFNPQLIGVYLFYFCQQTQFLPKSSAHGPLSQENDPIILEDSTTRVTLKGFPFPITTGVIASIRGSVILFIDNDNRWMIMVISV